MISYELAKELKDLGLPQYGDGKVFAQKTDGTWVSTYINHTDPYDRNRSDVYDPTLSELIKWCGANISDFDLRNSFIGGSNPILWTATLLQRDGNERLFQGQGSTPEEAVARLGIATHKR